MIMAFFIVQEKMKRATVGPLPGVTQDIAGFKVKYYFFIFLFSVTKKRRKKKVLPIDEKSFFDIGFEVLCILKLIINKFEVSHVIVKVFFR